MFFFRKANEYKHIKIIALFFRFILRRLRYKYGFQIPLAVTIGHGFYIGHFGTVVINKGTKIGNNCNIAHNVTIGQTNRGKLKGYPSIGDKVWIGTGSIIVGGVNIGNDVLIAPNTYVNTDVPSNSIVIGNPAKIISRPEATLDYINNIYLSEN
ncbi:serine O-acetyltransferase [Tenacibaculum finnmarkense]|nr:serine acetyltransferase [Tenacibaculum finnmarkense]